MERSLPNFAKDAMSSLRDSILQGRMLRSAYVQMDQESENEDDEAMTHSLFYSTRQDQNAESIPLTESHEYSDRSQLIFDQEDEQDLDLSGSPIQHSYHDENPKPSTIYLDTPFETPSAHPNPKPLSESLLPTTAAIPPGITSITIDRKYRDPFFAALYCIALGAFMISGIVILFTTNSHAIERYARGTTFNAIKETIGILSIMTVTALAAGVAWLLVLRTFTKVIVWGTVVCVPLAFAGIFIWTLVESLHRHVLYGSDESHQDTNLTIMSFIPLLLSLFYARFIYSSRHRISKTVAIIELACDVLRNNPGIIIVSLLLMAIFIVFTVIWLVFFSRLWLLGHVDKSSSQSTAIWVVNNNVYWFATFYIFVYMWTAAVLINIQRFTLSAVTAQWYFHRHEPSKSHSDKTWKSALIRSFSTSLGTVAIGGLILSIVQLLQFMATRLKKYVKKSGPFVSIISMALSYIEALVSQINHYVISLAGITNESFCASARSGTKIFRRNLLSGLLGDLVTKLVLYIGALLISLLSGFGTYIFATHSLHSSHGFIVGLLATIVPMYISQFFSYTLMSIVDATFLCYAIDLDIGLVHYSQAHSIFSGFN